MTLDRANEELDKMVLGLSYIPFISYAAIVQSDNSEYKIEYGLIKKKKFVTSGLATRKNIYSILGNTFDLIGPRNDFKVRISSGIYELPSTLRSKKINQFQSEKLVSGIAISNYGISNTSGTLGALFYSENEEDVYGLTNNHVIHSYYSNDKEIIHPGWLEYHKDKKLTPKKIGETVWSNDPKLDAAIFKVNNDTPVESGDLYNKSTYNNLGKALFNETVFKVGKKTAKKQSKVISPRTIMNISLKNGESIVVDNIIMIERRKGTSASVFSEDGDSGSLIFNSKRNALGLLFAQDIEAERSFAIDINNILSTNGNLINTGKPPFKFKKFV